MSGRMVYLAGPITGVSYAGATEWRTLVVDELGKYGIVGVSPMRWKKYLTPEGSIADSYEDFPLSSQRGMTARDRFDCQRCDIVLVNLLGATRISIGTMIELGWADAARRPIVLVSEPGNPHDHAMVREVSPYIVGTLGHAIDVCIGLLAP